MITTENQNLDKLADLMARIAKSADANRLLESLLAECPFIEEDIENDSENEKDAA